MSSTAFAFSCRLFFRFVVLTLLRVKSRGLGGSFWSTEHRNTHLATV